jgi:GntR family transcriptional regulator
MKGGTCPEAMRAQIIDIQDICTYIYGKGTVMSYRSTPAYLRIAEDLKEKITTDQYGVGGLIPPEQKLQEQYSTSRTTIRNAIDVLEKEGLLSRKQGRGTVVVSRYAVQQLKYISCFTDALHEKGIKTETGLINIRRIPANSIAAGKLQIPINSFIYLMQRTKLAEGRVFGFLNTRVVAELVPDLERHADLIREEGFYETLEKIYKLEIHTAVETISVHMSSDFENEIFEIDGSVPLFQNERITKLNNGRIFEYATTYVRTENFEYRVALQGRRKPESGSLDRQEYSHQPAAL